MLEIKNEGGRLEEVPLGCWCVMVLKARLKGATCWARENGSPFGWSDDLLDERHEYENKRD